MRILGTDILYKNPSPHVKSRHAYFPSIVRLPSGEMVASFAIGEAFEAVDLHTELSRSLDGGKSWEHLGPAFGAGDGTRMCESSRITALADGAMVAFVVETDRDQHPGCGLSNEENLGFVETRLRLSRSKDGGVTWSHPERFDPPLTGPSFELCSPILVLEDRWLLPTSTWRGWDGYEPNGMKMVTFISRDGGLTWPEYADVMADPDGAIIFWESKIVPLADGRLLAVAWAYDEPSGTDRPNQYTLSGDGGESWTAPQSTGLSGQTLTPTVLPDGRVVSIYRRLDKPGLWANVSEVDGDEWKNVGELPLWDGGVSSGGGKKETDSDMVETFQQLRFGAPTVLVLPDGTVYTAFWAYENCTSVIRWIHLEI